MPEKIKEQTKLSREKIKALIFVSLFLLAVVLNIFVSCSNQDTVTMRYYPVEGKTIPVNRINAVIPRLDFQNVSAQPVVLFEAENGRLIEGAMEPYAMIRNAFYISGRPLSKQLYEKHMGKESFPESGLSVEDVEEFLDVVYKKTGIPLRLPSESMYQAALHSGAINPGKKDEVVLSDIQGMERSLDAPLKVRNSDGSVGETWIHQYKVKGWHIVRSVYERTKIESFRRRGKNVFYLAYVPQTDTRATAFELAKEIDPAVEDIAMDVVGEKRKVEVGAAVIEMIPVKGGYAVLGGTEEQGDYADEDEQPIRQANLKDYMISRTEVTVGQWEAVMGVLPYGNNPKEKDYPVVNVSWFDAQRFCRRLGEMTGLHFRLPSENEWEYAARGGRKSKGYIFAGGNNAADYVVCSKKNKKGESVTPHSVPVATKLPNELGLYDMSGNVWEWVRGVYDASEETPRAVMRGGSRKGLNTTCRVSNRQASSPYARKDTFGFRVAL